MKLSCPKHRYLDEMKPLSTSDDPVELLMISEITYDNDSDHVNPQYIHTQKSPCNQSESTNDSEPVPKTSILMPDAI